MGLHERKINPTSVVVHKGVGRLYGLTYRRAPANMETNPCHLIERFHHCPNTVEQTWLWQLQFERGGWRKRKR